MTTNDDLGIVIAAGGSSSRFGSENKLFALLDNKPVFIHCLLEFCKVINPKNIIITVPEVLMEEFSQILKQYQLDIPITPGGATRTQSVQNGINALPSKLKYVAIHDAARPLVTNDLLYTCYKTAIRHQAAIPGKRVNDTLKRVSPDGRIVETVNREQIVAVETPQVFNLKSLLASYDKAKKDTIEATDDAGIMEYSGYAPHIVISEKLNIKITYVDDIKIAQAYLI